MLAVLIGLLGASTLAAVALAAGLPGVGYLAIYALALAPGLPLGFALFGRRHALGWIVGAALGYFLTALAIWAVIAVHAASLWAFVGAWALMTLVTWLVGRALDNALITVQPWTARDTRALLLVLLLVPAIAGPPFAKVGAADADGNRYYRAYFTADFVWHAALTAELKKFSMPPRNPFMASRPIHYYWTYFLLPAAVSGAGPAALTDVEANLKVNAIATAFLLVSAMFIAAWAAVPRAGAVAAATALAILASSAEGLFAIVRLWQRGAPLSALRELNIDALANWWFGGLRIDGIQRCFWWVPQHSTAYALGLAGFAVATATGSGASLGAIAVAGVALAGAVAFNPFVGGILSLSWGAGVAIDALASGDLVRRLLRHAVAAVPVLGALAWCSGNQMFEGAVGVLEFGLRGDAAHAPVPNLLLSLGPALIPALLGIALAVRARHVDQLRRVAVPLSLVLAALGVMHFVRLNVDISWVGFRGGQMILIAVPSLVALGFAAAKPWRTAAVVTAALALVIGLPTTVIDEYNAQDISNRLPGPGFPWTETLDRPHREALDWMKRATPPTSIVQQDGLSRDRTTWWVVPMFGERRMAAGLPPFLVNVPEYRDKSERVRGMYATADAQHAWATAHALGIDYIYLDEVERAAYPEGAAKFQDRRYFAPAFTNAAVTVYRVE